MKKDEKRWKIRTYKGSFKNSKMACKMQRKESKTTKKSDSNNLKRGFLYETGNWKWKIFEPGVGFYINKIS